MGRRNKTLVPEKFDDFVAPWERDAEGKDIPEDEQVVDKERLARYLFDLQTDKARLQKTVETLETEKTEREKADEAKEREGESEIDGLKREIAALKDAPKKDDVAEQREAALDYIVEKYKHLDLKTARNLARRAVASASGDDVEDEVDGFVNEFGLAQAPAEDDDDDDEPNPLQRQPAASGGRRRGRAGGDPNGGKGEDPSPLDGKSVDDLFPPAFS